MLFLLSGANTLTKSTSSPSLKIDGSPAPVHTSSLTGVPFPNGATIDEIRMRSSTVLCKTFLHYLPKLMEDVSHLNHSSPTLNDPSTNPIVGSAVLHFIWERILDILKEYWNCGLSNSKSKENKSGNQMHESSLSEGIPESLKNMLLVMSTSGCFDSQPELWEMTWNHLNSWLPSLKQELFPETIK